MADLAGTRTDFLRRFLEDATYLGNRCAEIEAAATEWDDLAREDQVDLLVEWALVRDRAEALRRLVAGGGLTAPDHDRYESLFARLARAERLVGELWRRP